MATLVLFTTVTQRAVKDFLNNPEKQALLRSPEAKKAYAEGVERVKQMAARRRALLAVDPDLRQQRITI